MTAVGLPARPLTIRWQSTFVDVEPGTRYGHRYDGAAVNTTLVVLNDTVARLTFPLILATTDPEEHDPGPRAVRVDAADEGWDALAAAIRAQGLSKGYPAERLDAYLESLRRSVVRAAKSELVSLEPGEERFVRTHQRKLLRPRRDGVLELRTILPLPQFALAEDGGVSVAVLLPAATPRFSVELLDWTDAGSPQAFGHASGLPAVGGRQAVAWTLRDDPELALSYRYAAG